MPSRFRSALAGVVVVLVGGTAGGQQAGELLGPDPAAAGRAGADLGIAEGALSIGTNPAGLAFLPSRRFDGALRLFFSQLDYAKGGESERSVDRLDPAPYFGVAWPRALGPASFGIAFFPEQGYRGKIRMTAAAQAGPGGTPPTERLAVETDSSTFAAAPAVAVRLSESFSIGAAALIESTRLSVEGFTEQPVGLFAGEVFPGITFGDFLKAAGFTIFQSDYDLRASASPTFAGRFGAMWKPAPGWSFGAFYRTRSTEARLAGNVTVDMGTQFGDPAFDPFFPDGRKGNYDLEVKGYRLPRSAGAGAAWEPGRGWRVAADLRWTDWGSAFEEFRFVLDGGDNGGFNTVIGDDGFEILFPLGWRDTFSGALGAEKRLEGGWTLRAGFAANENPVPDRTASVFAPAFTRWHAAAGASRRVGAVEYHGAWVHSFREEVSIRRSEVAGEFSRSRIGFSVDSLVFGVSVRF